MQQVAEVMESALALSINDRAALAEKLLASLDDLDEAETERLWATEAQRRLDGIESGRARTIPAEELAAKIESLLR